MDDFIARLRELGIHSGDLAADRIEQLEARLNRTLQDHGRMLWRDDIEGHCPSFDLCSEYADNGLRCSPCATKQSEAAGVPVMNFGKPYSPEEWRMKRANEALTAERDRLAAELAGAREALGKVIDACDRGRTIPKNGACGMTIEAQIRASCINGVDAWPIEEARETFYALATQENTDAAT